MDSESADLTAARLLTAFFDKHDRSERTASVAPLSQVIEFSEKRDEQFAGTDRPNQEESPGAAQRD